MEPVTHFLTGACMGRAGFNRKTGLATATMILAAEAPDMDILGEIKGSAFGFAHHRGFTHSFLGLFIIEAAVVGLMYGIWRLRGQTVKIKDEKLPPRWGLLFLFAYIAGLSHILLDFTNNYGVRPFWPFVERWYSWDIVFIADPVMLILLVAGLLFPALSALIDGEFGVKRKTPRGRLAASLALFGIVVMWGVRDYEHRRAVNLLNANSYQGANPVRASAYPYWWTPMQWSGVVETEKFLATVEVNTLTGEVDPRDEMGVHHKPQENSATLAAKGSYLGRAYLDWAQYPIIESESLDSGNSIVHFKDLRYARSGRGGKGALSASVELDKDMRVVWQGFGSPPDEGLANAVTK